MRLPSAGREYWTPELSALPAGFVAIEASYDGGAVWHPLTVVDGADRSVLIAGPDAPADAEPTVTLPLGRTWAQAKLVGPDGIEIVIRTAGVIDVVDMPGSPSSGLGNIDGGSAEG